MRNNLNFQGMMRSHPLLKAWKEFRPECPPYLLQGDEPLLNGNRGKSYACVYRTYDQFVKSPDLGSPSGCFHLGLLPVPFIGHLETAKVFILTLNPGLGPHDYFGEERVSEYRYALQRNLRQTIAPGRHPFLFLNPRFAWHGGFQYWHNRLSSVVRELARHRRESYHAALRCAASCIAVLELVPYHSPSYRLPEGPFGSLRSVELIRAFVHKILIRQVDRGSALIIVVRKANAWGLEQQKGIIIYKGVETRSADLSVNTRGGRAILELLKRKNRRRCWTCRVE